VPFAVPWRGRRRSQTLSERLSSARRRVGEPCFDLDCNAGLT
jgi:hypothetical protein